METTSTKTISFEGNINPEAILLEILDSLSVDDILSLERTRCRGDYDMPSVITLGSLMTVYIGRWIFDVTKHEYNITGVGDKRLSLRMNPRHFIEAIKVLEL